MEIFTHFIRTALTSQVLLTSYICKWKHSHIEDICLYSCCCSQLVIILWFYGQTMRFSKCVWSDMTFLWWSKCRDQESFRMNNVNSLPHSSHRWASELQTHSHVCGLWLTFHALHKCRNLQVLLKLSHLNTQCQKQGWSLFHLITASC